MLVFEAFRGQGVARALIDELLRHANARAIYCIPFADLEPLYQAAGFARTDHAPATVMEKYEWCTRTYDKPVVLMECRAGFSPPTGAG
jgi:GNAT superfamily N-acetyltransferase